ncbi:MAG: L,D-transpeptidase family protein [Firmicutes bacterium]|nr:L,D-transpeptidase family protein [Bacillota bacterium]
MKKLISLLLSVCMVVTLIPTVSFAAGTDDPLAGTDRVLAMEAQGDNGQGQPDEETPAADDVLAADDADETAAPEEDIVPEDAAMPEEGEGQANAPLEGEITVQEGDPDVELQEEASSTVIEWKQEPVEAPVGWRCYVDGVMKTNGMQQVGAGYYFFDASGYMQTGCQQYSGNYYYFIPMGKNPATDQLGVRASGWQDVSGIGKCYFDLNTGIMKTGWQNIDGKRYYFQSSGARLTGLNKIGSTTYYLNPEMKIGSQTISGKKYYFNTSSGGMVKGWLTIGSAKYYYDPSNGVMKTGWQTIKDNKYYFNPSDGAMVKGWQTISKKKYYFNLSSGKMTKGLLTIGKDKYYLNPTSGVLMTGWQKISGDKYYFNTSNGKMYKGGPIKIGKKKYYFNTSSGKMTKGWQNINGKKYFFDASSGAMKTGWLTYHGKKYYLKTSGAARIGLATIKGNRYYFQGDGSMMKNRAVKVKGKLYYFLNSGKGYKKKGWFKGSDGAKRYSLGKGRVQTGKKKIKGVWYQFDKTTGIAKTLGDSFDISIQSKTSKTAYLIAIKRSAYQVRVYQGSKNNWTRIKKMDCGVGAAATPTPAGTYTTTSRRQVSAYNLDGTQVRYWYHTQFIPSSDRGLHSGLYYVETGKPYDTALRTATSQGSVRLSLGNAEWIYYNVPLDTTVYIK